MEINGDKKRFIEISRD